MNNYIKKETDKYGSTFYYNDKDQLHRTDGPAVEFADGDKHWHINGNLHRLDGPAIEWADGGKSWYVNDEYLEKEEFDNHPLVVEYKLGKMIEEVLSE